jgi:hypothetical protein
VGVVEIIYPAGVVENIDQNKSPTLTKIYGESTGQIFPDN